MHDLFLNFKHAHYIRSGALLAFTITPIAPAAEPLQLQNFYHDFNSFNISSELKNGLLTPKADIRLPKAEGNAWVDIYVAYWKVLGEIIASSADSADPVESRDSQQQHQHQQQVNWPRVYEAWKEVANALIRGYTSAGFQAWTVPCLYVAGRYLRLFAIKADESLRGTGDDEGRFAAGSGGFQDDITGGELGKNEKLEDSARMINRIFTLCISDRAPLDESRKWGLYYTTNLLFKTYFKLNAIGLSKNILRALQASQTDMPAIEDFPKSHIVTFRYYVGVILFLDENYQQAEENLTNALNMCHRDAHRNKELILTYLIPCHLLTTHTLPSATLLRPYPRLHTLFTPLSNCIRKGDLAGFDAALAAGENEFVKRRIYLTLERGRDIALRNLFRKVFVAGGWEGSKDGVGEGKSGGVGGGGGERIRRTRVPLIEFIAAIRLGSGVRTIDGDEVECLLANMIYKNLIKGYISRDRGIVVLSKSGAFPGTGV